MPNVAVASIVSSVANKLSATLIEEAGALRDVERHVEWIERELRLMQASLEHVGRTTEQGFSEWVDKLEEVALEAQEVIETFVLRSIKRRRAWILHLVDRYKIGKELERIRNKIIDISQERIMKEDAQISQHANIGVVVETPREASGPARALQTLSSVLSENLDDGLKEMVEEVKDDMASIHKIMSNLWTREQPTRREMVWMNEVNQVCDFTTSVIEGFDARREEWAKMGWLKRLCLLLSASAPEGKFTEEMKCVQTQTRGALRRGLTYEIVEEEGVRDRRRSMPMSVSVSLEELLIRRVIYMTCYVTVFPLLGIWDLSLPLVVLSFVIFAITYLPIVDLWKAKGEGKIKILKSVSRRILIDFVIFTISYLVPYLAVLLLQFGSVLFTTIYWNLFEQASLKQKLESIQRELALMHAFLGCAQVENERERVWVEKIRAMVEQVEPLLHAYEHVMERYEQDQRALKRLILNLRLLILRNRINVVFHKMHDIWEMKTTYCISNIRKREGVFSWGQSSQGSWNDSISDAEEDPLLAAVGSSSHQLQNKGLMLSAVESFREEDMQFMEALFKDVQEMGELDGRSKIWVEEMRGIHREIKLVSNEYASKLEGKPIHVYIRKYPTIWIINKEISQIRNQIQDASRRRKTYGLFRLQTRLESHQLQTLDMINMNLPLYLRKCLFYFALFPAEREIPARRLVALWLAEGLVHQGEDKEPPEKVAEGYLKDLIDLEIVGTAKRKRNGKVNTCFLPNDLREKWLGQRPDATNSDSAPESPTIRRVTDNLNDKDKWHNDIHSGAATKSANLRASYADVLSFLSFDTREGSKPGQEIGNFLDRCISSGCFLLLRVLDLEHVYKPQLPENIGSLSRLRYLGLRWTYLESLPSSVRKLLKLQTLDLKHTYINVLTSSIWKMELRHLFLSETYRTRFPPQRKRNYLSELQTLSGLFVDEETPIKGALDKLVNVKKLGLTCQSMALEPQAMVSQLEAIADWIMELKQLESLRLKSRDEKGRPWVLHLRSLENHERLNDMYLLGSLSSSSLLSTFPQSLSELTLSHSCLKDDPMQFLAYLQNLRSLCFLAGSYSEKAMTCNYRSFQKLLVLKFWKLEELEEWNIEEEALPCLEILEIRSCESLKMLPDGLQHVKSLKELTLTDMPMEITRRVRKPDGKDWHKVSHITEVNIDGSQ